MNTNKPIHSLKDGLIAASIWKNEADGKTRYSVTFARSFLKDEEWQTSYSFSGSELLRLARLSEQAFDWIKTARRNDAERAA